jgi:hypothetical protein
MGDHEHDLVRVEDAANGLAWQTCRSCPFRTDGEPWDPAATVNEAPGGSES